MQTEYEEMKSMLVGKRNTTQKQLEHTMHERSCYEKEHIQDDRPKKG